ncbi:uncharacterized protein LOC131317629 isoform X2 [Rhododendron vialii]|uniref:uncharacterized protein LOC131317629 isoform X2 n=1 Tax=Rhododendron vialii TaxID=182163 RepID=UPI00265DE4AD|nr:uncharacterized protein LOC131317629 isoform X2 [Rhododendron vialii]
MISSTSLISVLPLVPLRRRCDGCCQSSIPSSFLSVSMPWFYPKVLQCEPGYRMQSCNSFSPAVKTHGRVLSLAEQNEDKFHVVSAIRSVYNDIVIVDTPRSRMLLLDSSHNVHSIRPCGEKWTGSYWDEFASLPAIVPRGPIAIFGLGAGTAAHLMLDLWPSLELHGWEIDQILVDKAREYFALSDLEKRTPTGGILHVCVGDALSPSVNVSGGYAGIVVDLFSDGKVLPQLQEVSTWLELHGKLMPNGRFMVNCGAANDGVSDTTSPESWSIDRSWVQNSTIRALCQAFPREVGLNWKKMPKEEGENYVALTGPLPDLATWSAVLPDRLSMTVNQWRPCLPL